MVDRIGGSGSLQREAILAALREHAKASDQVTSLADKLAPGAQQPEVDRTDFAKTLNDGLVTLDQQIRRAEGLGREVVEGRVTDFAEVAARVKSADLSFKFALEIRNKLIEAYREVMRMQV